MLFIGFSEPSLFSVWEASLVFVGEEVLMSRVARGLVGDVGVRVDIVVSEVCDGGIGWVGWSGVLKEERRRMFYGG